MVFVAETNNIVVKTQPARNVCKRPCAPGPHGPQLIDHDHDLVVVPSEYVGGVASVLEIEREERELLRARALVRPSIPDPVVPAPQQIKS